MTKREQLFVNHRPCYSLIAAGNNWKNNEPSGIHIDMTSTVPQENYVKHKIHHQEKREVAPLPQVTVIHSKPLI